MRIGLGISVPLSYVNSISTPQGGIDSYTKLMLHNDDVGLTDSEITPKTVTLVGSVARSATQSKFGGYSAIFNGTTDLLSLADSADWTFGTGDFTVDAWIYQSSAANTGLFAQYADGNNRMFSQVLATGAINFLYQTTATIRAYYFTAGGVVATSGWHHIAFVRNGTSFNIYYDGVAQSLTASTAIGSNDLNDISALFTVGGNAGLGNYFNGYIDEFRVSKGIARWTANFTPPLSAYTT